MKTKLGGVLIDNNEEDAKKRAKLILKGMSEEQIKEYLIYGTTESVLQQIGMLENAGIQYFIVNLDPSRQFEELELFANSIIEKMR